jgi:hypothetical protein
VRDRFLSVRSLLDYAALLERVVADVPAAHLVAH